MLIYVNIEDVDDPLSFARKVRRAIGKDLSMEDPFLLFVSNRLC